MEKLLVLLQEIQDLASDIHYNYSYKAEFFSIHKLMDEVRDPVSGFVDDIKEVIYLGHGSTAPACKLISSQTVEFPLDLLSLKNLLDDTIQHIEDIKDSMQVDSGSCAVLDAISQHCLKYSGLLFRLV